MGIKSLQCERVNKHCLVSVSIDLEMEMKLVNVKKSF